MKRITKQLFTLSSISLFALSLVGCHNEVFKVTFKDRDGNVIYETKVKYGENAKFVGDLPHVPADKVYCYPFTGWSKSIKHVTSNLEVTAVHGQEYNIYDFDFVIDPRVFQGVTSFDENTTTFIGYYNFMGGILVYLKEGVMEDGEEKTSTSVPVDDTELVNFDYSQVDISTNGTYPFSMTVMGLKKETTIKVVTNTSNWTKIKEVGTPYKTSVTGPDFESSIDLVYFYEEGGFIFDSITLDEFDPFYYEEVEENVFVITSEDESTNCKYIINGDGEFATYDIDGVMHNIDNAGNEFQWVQFTTATEFTEEKTGYAFIGAMTYAQSHHTLTVKYEYNPDTLEMKIFAPLGFNSLKYNPETGHLERIE